MIRGNIDMSYGRRPLRIDDILSKDLGDETILYTRAGDNIHVLNITAQVVWEFCDGEHTVREIEQALREKFEVEEGKDADIATDVRNVLKVFDEKGLLQDTATDA